MEISRRDFLKLLGVTSAGLSLTSMGCDLTWSIPEDMYQRIAGSPRIETWKTSVCSLCPAGCGIKVRLIDGIPVRINGNPIHPVNRGGICPMAEAGVEMLFSPDRLKGPLKRVGERGANQWQSITWDEALQIVVEQLQRLRQSNQPHKLAFVNGNTNNLLTALTERFVKAFGSPNVFHFDETHFQRLSTYITQGRKNLQGYDFNKVNLLINLGADLLDTGPSPVRFNQLYSELRSRENGQRTKIVHIDSRLSRTAGSSSEWVPIKPATMAALALALANVMIRDGQYDRDFVKTRSFGFDDWTDQDGSVHEGFKSIVSREYSPEKVAGLTGVTAAQIVALAREFAASESAVVIGGGQAGHSSNGLYTLWAIDCLNALKGNFAKEGPIFLQSPPPFSKLPSLQLDEVAKTGLEETKLTRNGAFCFPDYAATNFPKDLLETKTTGIDVLMVADVNPVFTAVNQQDFIAAFEKIPFIVSFSPFLDETNNYADLVLPDHVFLEKYEVLFNAAMAEFRHCGVQQPVIKPIYNTRQVGDVLLQISKRLGEPFTSVLPWQDYKGYIYARLEGVYKTGTGTIFTERMDEEWLRFLKERGWQILEYSNMEEFWQTLLEKGGWWDPFPENSDFSAAFATPSKKFEFYSQILRNEIGSQVAGKQAPDGATESLLQKWKIVARGDVVYLPHFEARLDVDTEPFDLHLLTHHLITNQTGIGNLSLLQELFGLLVHEYWRSYVEIHPETAHERGISDGDLVRVTSLQGSLQARAKIHPGIMPEVISMPFGLGHKVSHTRYSREIGVNPHEIFIEDYDFLTGSPDLTGTKVIMQKVGEKEQV